MNSREQILQSYEDLLIAEGPGAVTIAGVAKHAGISKGGVFHHFGTKLEMTDALVDRYRQLGAIDIEQARKSSDPVVYFLEACTGTLHLDGGFLRAELAIRMLADAQHAQARDALAYVHGLWRDLLLSEVASPLVAETVLAVGDGAYLHRSLGLEESPLRGQARSIAAWLRKGPDTTATGSTPAESAPVRVSN